MKRVFSALMLAGVLFAGMAYAATQTFEGFVSDTMCGKTHMMPGKSDAKCIRECVKAGAGYALVVKDKVYTLKGDTRVIDAFAGKQVHVSGELQGTTITVSKIQ